MNANSIQRMKNAVDAAINAKTAEEAIAALNSTRGSIRRAGGRPNYRFYRAVRAAKWLLAEAAKPATVVPGANYSVIAHNGKEFKIFVPQKSDVFREAKFQNIEVASFSKIENGGAN